jgi:N-acetylmuramoyl-L-alanine amidase
VTRGVRRTLSVLGLAAAACVSVWLARAEPPAPEAPASPAVSTEAPPDSAAAAPRRASDWRTLIGGPGPESVPVKVVGGRRYVAVADLAQLLDATKFWRSDLRKFELRTPSHRVQLTAENPFAIVDDHTVTLPMPVLSVDGELLAPVALVDSLPRVEGMSRLVLDTDRNVVLRVPASGVVGTPRVQVEGGVTRLVFPVDRADEVVVAGRGRAHFRLRFSGFHVGTLPTSMPEGSLVRSIQPIATAGGSAFELAVAPAAAGYRLEPDRQNGRVTLTFQRSSEGGLEPFAPEGPSGPREVQVIVIDPGHGGGDAGVTASGATEKVLTLQLARLLREELARRMRVQVVLTREDDRAATAEERAERANRARADLVISLHFDGMVDGRARGVTAYCPPATYAGADDERGRGLVAMVPWRDVALRHAVSARDLSEFLLSSFELHALGPTRLREILPYPMLGVNAPGLLLECATLTSEADRQRVLGPRGLSDLAVAIAEGIEIWQRNP